VNTTLYDHFWFWSAKKEARRKSLDELLRVYYESAGQSAVMLLNSTPNTDGLIPEPDMALYRALGTGLDRRFSKPLAETSGPGDALELDLGRPRAVNHVIVMEDYRQGERIREFVVEGWDGNTWRAITGGEHVGRKHIGFFDEVVMGKLRLRITKAAAPPIIRSFSAHLVTSFNKPALTQPDRWKTREVFAATPADAGRDGWTACAKWTAASFQNGEAKLQVNLSGRITEAGQWEVRFAPDDRATKLGFADAVLRQQGQESVAGALTQSRDHPNLWHVNRTAVVTEGSEDILLEITLRATPCAGTVLIRRI
jgi:alpha-L-fucosidase